MDDGVIGTRNDEVEPRSLTATIDTKPPPALCKIELLISADAQASKGSTRLLELYEMLTKQRTGEAPSYT